MSKTPVVKSKICQFCIFGVFFALVSACTPSWAWDGVFAGKAQSVEVDAGTNYAFRVYLNPAPSAMCAGGPIWAFINETDSNYKVYVAALLAAKAQGSSVTVYSNAVGAFCRIGHLVVGP